MVEFSKPLTPTEQRFWDHLKDGQMVNKHALWDLLYDELANRNGSAIHVHIHKINKKIISQHELVCRSINRGHYYQLFGKVNGVS